MSAPTFGEWLPIETAPKDGTSILLHGSWSGEIGCDVPIASTVGFWSYDEWVASITDYYSVSANPTHWMPLPPPPKTTA